MPTLKLSHGHTMYYEEHGNPKGVPVVRLHGGPGSGSKPSHTDEFDLKTQRVILYDQRGCGKSKPLGDIKHNTTQLLIQDLERLREHLGLEKWHVVGFSWGSTLALAYAQAHPKRVQSIVTGAVLLATQAELEWFTHPTGMARFVPREYAEAMALVPRVQPNKLPAALLKILTGSNRKRALDVARRWTLLESMSCELTPNREAIEAYIKADKNILPRNIIFWHYFGNRCFLTEKQLLKNAHKIKHIPTHIIQGGLDLDCPPAAAYVLAKALPKAQFTLVPLAGHRATPEVHKLRQTAIKKLAKAR